jgi:hypothetical protein
MYGLCVYARIFVYVCRSSIGLFRFPVTILLYPSTAPPAVSVNALHLTVVFLSSFFSVPSAPWVILWSDTLTCVFCGVTHSLVCSVEWHTHLCVLWSETLTCVFCGVRRSLVCSVELDTHLCVLWSEALTCVHAVKHWWYCAYCTSCSSPGIVRTRCVAQMEVTISKYIILLRKAFGKR